MTAWADLRQRVQQLVDAWILRCRDCEAEAERFKGNPTSAEFGEWARTASGYRLCARELCDVMSSLDASGETPPPYDASIALQSMYDATTRLISWAPTGRVDLGATQEYHDALLKLTNLRATLRDDAMVVHDEKYWHDTASTPEEGERG